MTTDKISWGFSSTKDSLFKNEKKPKWIWIQKARSICWPFLMHASKSPFDVILYCLPFFCPSFFQVFTVRFLSWTHAPFVSSGQARSIGGLKVVQDRLPGTAKITITKNRFTNIILSLSASIPARSMPILRKTLEYCTWKIVAWKCWSVYKFTLKIYFFKGQV